METCFYKKPSDPSFMRRFFELSLRSFSIRVKKDLRTNPS
jgi:hypothetical protein